MGYCDCQKGRAPWRWHVPSLHVHAHRKVMLGGFDAVGKSK